VPSQNMPTPLTIQKKSEHCCNIQSRQNLPLHHNRINKSPFQNTEHHSGQTKCTCCNQKQNAKGKGGWRRGGRERDRCEYLLRRMCSKVVSREEEWSVYITRLILWSCGQKGTAKMDSQDDMTDLESECWCSMPLTGSTAYRGHAWKLSLLLFFFFFWERERVGEMQATPFRHFLFPPTNQLI